MRKRSFEGIKSDLEFLKVKPEIKKVAKGMKLVGGYEAENYNCEKLTVFNLQNSKTFETKELIYNWTLKEIEQVYYTDRNGFTVGLKS